MNCFVHPATAAVGFCVSCQRGVCRACVGTETPRIVCQACAARGGILGYEYRSAAAIGDWPLVHICFGVDPMTMRPRVARGALAIGNIAVGGIAIGGLALGMFTLGGLSVGIAGALGGLALGVGVSFGGLAIGSVAVGGVAVGFMHAIGGVAVGPSIISGTRCDEAARAFFERWGALPQIPSCR